MTTRSHPLMSEAAKRVSAEGGAPLLIALETLEEERPGVKAKGERLRLGLEALGLDVRGIGLMLGFATADGPGLVSRALTEQRLVLNATGPDTVRLLPPLNASEADLDEAVSRIGALV